MTNKQRILNNNNELQNIIDIVNELPTSGGGSSGVDLDAFCVIDPYGSDPYGYGVVFEKGMTWEELINSSYNIDNRITSVNGYVMAYGGDHADKTYISMYSSAGSNSDLIRTADKIVATQYYNVDYVPTDSGDSGEVKTFTLENFAHESADNYDNTFYFKEGMTWKEWKASTYNSWFHSNYGEFKFETYHNGSVSIDVGCNPDTPIEGVCNADGTPVKDSEVIQAITYLYVDDLDSYGYEETITFTITFPDNYGTKTFLAISGMTWGEWVTSDYNNDSFSLSDRGNILFDEGGYDFSAPYAVYDGAQVHKDEVINADYAYDYDTYY